MRTPTPTGVGNANTDAREETIYFSPSARGPAYGRDRRAYGAATSGSAHGPRLPNRGPIDTV